MLETYFVETGGFYVGKMVGKNAKRLSFKMKLGGWLKSVSNGGREMVAA